MYTVEAKLRDGSVRTFRNVKMVYALPDHYNITYADNQGWIQYNKADVIYLETLVDPPAKRTYKKRRKSKKGKR